MSELWTEWCPNLGHNTLPQILVLRLSIENYYCIGEPLIQRRQKRPFCSGIAPLGERNPLPRGGGGRIAGLFIQFRLKVGVTVDRYVSSLTG